MKLAFLNCKRVAAKYVMTTGMVGATALIHGGMPEVLPLLLL